MLPGMKEIPQMRLSAPKKGSFAISIVIGLSAILFHYVLPVDVALEFLMLAFAFILLLLATMLKGL